MMIGCGRLDARHLHAALANTPLLAHSTQSDVDASGQQKVSSSAAERLREVVS